MLLLRFLQTAALLVVVFLFANAQLGAVADLGCVTDEDESERIRKLMFESLDRGFKDHMTHLFEIWLREKAVPSGRAVAGAQLGVRAYQRSYQEILTWKPPICGKGK